MNLGKFDEVTLPETTDTVQKNRYLYLKEKCKLQYDFVTRSLTTLGPVSTTDNSRFAYQYHIGELLRVHYTSINDVGRAIFIRVERISNNGL